VPCTTTRLSIRWERTQVPYTVTRTVRGCYCDGGDCSAKPGPNGVVTGSPNSGAKTYDSEAPGRVFVEGGTCSRTVQEQTVRMVRENVVQRVPYTVTRNVPETITQRIPVTVTRMVPTTVEKMVPVTTCRMVQETSMKQVPTKVCTTKQEVVTKTVPVHVCKMVPYTVTKKVPYEVTECVPTTVCKQVPVCKEYEVCVKKPRVVQETCPTPAPTCPTNSACCPAPCGGPFHNPNAAYPGLFSGWCDKLKCRLGCGTCEGK
jgi:hypothetical protein